MDLAEQQRPLHATFTTALTTLTTLTITPTTNTNHHHHRHTAINNTANRHRKHDPSPLPDLPDRLLIGGASATGFVLLCLILLWLFGVRPILARASSRSNNMGQQSGGGGGVSGGGVGGVGVSGVDIGAARRARGDIQQQVQMLDPRLLPTKPKRGRGRRLVVVGDVHGCRAELEALLSKIDFIPSHDHLILAGDMINKGPDSHGVIALARSLDASAVRGNHEDKVLRARASMNNSPSYTPSIPANSSSGGGGDNNDPAETLARELSNEDIRWLAQRPLILSVGRIPGLPFANTVVVHAGLVPNVALEAQDPYDVMNMRSIVEKTMKASERRDVGTQWWKVWNAAQERLPKGKRTLVVYGHHAKEGLVEEDYSIGLDSGCVKGGMLSALVLGGVDKHGNPKMNVVSVRYGAHR